MKNRAMTTGNWRACLAVRQGQVFVDGLGAGVGPADDGGRAIDHVVVFVEGDLGSLAVDLGARGDEDLGGVARGAACIGKAEEALGLGDVGVDRADGVLHHQAHAHGGGEVVDLVEDLAISKGIERTPKIGLDEADAVAQRVATVVMAVGVQVVLGLERRPVEGCR